MESEALKRFEWIITFLICRFRFVHTILGMMTKIPDYSIETIGVWVTADGRFELIYNPVFIDGMEDWEVTYVFYHEVLHLALLHCTKRKLGDKKIANIAHDLAINELIPEIEGTCTPPRDKKGELIGTFVSEMRKEKMFKDIKSKQSAEWYYDYIIQKIKENKKSKPQMGNGSFDDHDGWKEHEVANARAEAHIKEIQSMNTWGDNISQGTIEAILAAQIRKINWRNLIRVWFGNQVWKERRYTRKKPNRRTGLMHPGTTKMYRDRWLVAADTSASIETDVLAEWLAVLNQLAEEIPIDFMQFDWDQTEKPHPYNRRRMNLDFKGRGGTNFQPVFDVVEEHRYKGVMILTDGEAAKPTKPKAAKVLWVLPVGKRPPVEWGKRVYMQRHT